MDVELKPQLWNTDSDGLLDFDLGVTIPVLFTNKPSIALWTSTAIPTKNGYTSEWLRWCENEHFPIGDNNFLLIPDHPKLLVIDSHEDLKKCHIAKNKEWLPYKVDNPFGDLIDFGWYIAHGYDGVHLTAKGAIDCHAIWDYTGNKQINLNAWDVESTCWFTTCWVKMMRRL